MQVWLLWLETLAGCILGCYFLPLDKMFQPVDGSAYGGAMSFPQLLPVWLLVTYLFVQPYQTASLRADSGGLREINALLQARDSRGEYPDERRIRFESGRTTFALNTGIVRNTTVEDQVNRLSCVSWPGPLLFQRPPGDLRSWHSSPILELVTRLWFVSVARPPVNNIHG